MGRQKIGCKGGGIVVVVCVMFLTMNVGFAQSADLQKKDDIQIAGLEICLEQALENNHRRPASRFALEMAQAQHRQTLAGYWPQITARGGYSRLDEVVNFNFSSEFSVPGFGPIPIDADIDVLVEKRYTAEIEATWLLYDGGMRKGYREQTQGLVDMMKQEIRRTDLEIIDDVQRFYWGAVMAKKLYRVGLDTLSRMNATLNLTETMYKEGAGTVKKTDWLNNKVMVDTLRSMVALLEKNKLMSRAALANTMGLSWDKSVEPEDTKIPVSSFTTDMGEIVEQAYAFNPDWAKVEAGLNAAEGALKTAKSGSFPKLALTGELHKWWPDEDIGLTTPENKQGWSFGVGVEIPIFSGMLTVNKIAAARAAIAKIKEEQLLLKEGIGLQVRDLLLSLGAAQKSCDASGNALTAAQENRKLNVRAYQSELVETDDVIQAQLTEALMAAQHCKARYEHAALLSRLDLIVGTEVLRQIE